MSIVSEDELRKHISTKRFAPVYLLYGDDSYLKNYYKDTLAKKASDGDPFFNLQKFEGDVELQEVFDAVNQFPMMAERKSVILADYDIHHCDKGDFARLLGLIADANDTCVLIICFDAVDFYSKRGANEKKIIDSVNKMGGCCAEINHRSITALVKMLSDGAAKRGCRLGEIAARYLIEISGNDLSTLKNELDKLCAYVGSGDITKEIINLVSVKSVDASVYDYAKEIFAGNISGALRLLDDMFFMHIEPMTILYNVSSSYVDMYRVAVAGKTSVPRQNVAEDFSYSKNKTFLLDRASQNLRKFDSKKLRLSLDCLAAADKELKSFGADARTVLEQLTVKLIYILTKGEAVD